MDLFEYLDLNSPLKSITFSRRCHPLSFHAISLNRNELVDQRLVDAKVHEKTLALVLKQIT